MQPITVDDLIEQARFQLDEDNPEDVSDARLLRALNAGANHCYKILARQFDQFFIDEKSFTTDGTAEVTIPSDAYARRVEYVTYTIDGRDYKVKKIQPTKMYMYQTGSNNSTYPSVYTTRGDKIIFGPIPKSGISGTIHYMRRPASLVKSSGRILATTATTITVDTLGSDITVDVDTLGAFFNVVDRSTGLRKVSLQVESISGTTITFKTASLNRATVYGVDIGTELPTTVAVDDYICPIGGTCVIEHLADYSDYITQYAVVEVKRSMQLPNKEDWAKLKDLESHVINIWAGREADSTVKHNNHHWSKNSRYRR